MPLIKATVSNGYVINFVPRVSDHRSKNGSAKAKSFWADQSRKLYPAISKSGFSLGFNVNTGDLLSVGNASKYVLMLSSFLPVAISGFLN